MILNDEQETNTAFTGFWLHHVRNAKDDPKMAQDLMWSTVYNGIRQSLEILEANQDPSMAMVDECNADSVAAVMAEAAWFAIFAIRHLQQQPSKALATLADARRRIYAWAIDNRPGIADTWECKGCGRMFTEPGVPHFPCRPL